MHGVAVPLMKRASLIPRANSEMYRRGLDEEERLQAEARGGNAGTGWRAGCAVCLGSAPRRRARRGRLGGLALGLPVQRLEHLDGDVGCWSS
jgi:hypothetical protein